MFDADQLDEALTVLWSGGGAASDWSSMSQS